MINIFSKFMNYFNKKLITTLEVDKNKIALSILDQKTDKVCHKEILNKRCFVNANSVKNLELLEELNELFSIAENKLNIILSDYQLHLKVNKDINFKEIYDIALELGMESNDIIRS